MSNLSAITKEDFTISSADVNGPLNLEETVRSAQTTEPEWLQETPAFTDVEVLNGAPVKYTVRQVGDVDHFSIEVRALSSKADQELIEPLRSHLFHVLGLRDDLRLFYRTFADKGEPLSSTFSRLRGLRLMRGTDLYVSLIFSILSQNNSAELMNRSARLMMQNYGSVASFPDGSSHHLFPTPEIIAKLSPRQLQARTSMGYRAKSVVEVSRRIVAGELSLAQLVERPHEETLEILLGLPGVGPKVADCFLLYGAGRLEAAPVDVWIHRIVSKLYFRERKVSRLKTGRFLRERFGKWAGYAQLYLFDYARRIRWAKSDG